MGHPLSVHQLMDHLNDMDQIALHFLDEIDNYQVHRYLQDVVYLDERQNQGELNQDVDQTFQGVDHQHQFHLLDVAVVAVQRHQ